MTNSDPWYAYLRLNKELTEIRKKLAECGSESYPQIRESLRHPEEGVYALRFAELIAESEREKLIPDILTCGLFVHGSTEFSLENPHIHI